MRDDPLRTNYGLFLAGAQSLATTTSSLAHLLAALYAGLQVMPAALEFAQNAFRGHLALKVLDRSFDALVADLDFERLTQYGFAGIGQGAPSIPHREAICKPKSVRPAVNLEARRQVRKFPAVISVLSRPRRAFLRPPAA